MKKSTIKRRKRVIPFIHDQSHASERSSHSVTESASPEASPVTLPDQLIPSPSLVTGDSATFEERPREQLERLRFDPPPVDFTDYRASPENVHNQKPPSPQQPPTERKFTQTQTSIHKAPPSDRGRKRSLSVAEGTHADQMQSIKSNPNRLSSISSILNPPQQQGRLDSSDDLVIDPSLHRGLLHNRLNSESYNDPLPSPKRQHLQEIYQPESPQQSVQRQPPTSQPPKDSDRKARLRREAEDLREMLRAKERELQELG